MKYLHYREKMEKMGTREARVRLDETGQEERQESLARWALLG